LNKKLADFEEQTTNQIAVLIIPTLEGDNLEDYSIRLADKWKIGQKGKDNGVILLIVKQDRKIRIEVGYGLEGVLPDGLAGEIILKNIAPHFRRGDFYNGIQEGVSKIIAATKGEYRAPHQRKWVLPVYVLFLLMLGVVFLWAMLRGGKIMKEKYKSWGVEGWWLGRGYSGGSGGFGGSFGGGFSGGGGGFGGGGGGFGGGGASGGW